MDFDSVVDTLTDHPIATAAAVVVGLFLLTRSGGGGGGTDMSATLESMRIASDTNVSLANVQVQRDIAAIQASRDIQLGAMDYAKTDRQASLAAGIESMSNSRLTAQTMGDQVLQAFQSALGFSAARKDLENQRASLDSMQALGFADISKDRELGAASISSARDLGLSEINANLDVALAGIDLDKYALPFTERMHYQEQETIRNLAWRQKQIAKYQSNADLFGGLISGGFSLLSSGLNKLN